ncbi:MAG: hypothetical protein UW68_C0012G0020 [Candidatus Collierbacteria bacterium GW2011_GWB1_44_6]|uniref:Uncharacterized protein n=2 Tax=Candidatus Collieribacteriota TaxID=1752725 RepID=A0A0G1LWX4_9BACT|nr:MAG: hypothetical protein UV68_C0027G0008 [Candidatus Collierbacteria bacterium GW2011_GWC2_43_12]KKT73327.1 MAG: hypothetical protein UW68_C0012G0020 [Candidatus Collierbacteria bacterium GW2011_GWB1_44_6]KKT82667.1 MAG: hypothetical protein UW80_C0033G0012 [Microgenomates group bacterium GW2011_GWC1_44_9]
MMLLPPAGVMLVGEDAEESLGAAMMGLLLAARVGVTVITAGAGEGVTADKTPWGSGEMSVPVG